MSGLMLLAAGSDCSTTSVAHGSVLRSFNLSFSGGVNDAVNACLHDTVGSVVEVVKKPVSSVVRESA